MCELTPEQDNPSPFDALAELTRLALRLADGKLPLKYRGRPLTVEAVEYAVSKAGEALASDPARFVSRAHLLNFLRLAAGRKAISDRRGRRGRCEFLADRAEAVADHRPAADKERAWSAEAVEALFASLRHMAEAERELIEKYYLKGLTDADIGVHLFGGAATRSAVGQRARKRRLRSLDQLRDLLGEDGDGLNA